MSVPEPAHTLSDNTTKASALSPTSFRYAKIRLKTANFRPLDDEIYSGILKIRQSYSCV